MKKRNFLIALCLVTLIVLCVTMIACNPTKYTVTFDGDGIKAFTQTVDKGKTVSQPDDVIREGYTLKGWKMDGEEYDFTTPVNKDITLEAVWQANKYTVTLGGSSQTKQVTFGENFDLGVAQTDEIKEFAGWVYNKKLITNEAGVSFEAWDKTLDITVEPSWTEGITVDGLTYVEQEDGTLRVSATKAYMFDSAVEIKSEIKGKKVTAIGAMQYLSCYELKVPSTVKEISASAFLGNNYVNTVDMSEFKGKIGDNAFKNSQVAIIDLGFTSSIGANAFENAQIGVLVIPSTVKTIGNRALDSNNLYEVTFEGDIPSLGEKVFGSGERDNNSGVIADSISIFATKTAWDKFTEGNNVISEINKKLGIEKSELYSLTEDAMSNYLEKAGIFAIDGDYVYRGAGNYAVLVHGGNSVLADIYDETHFYLTENKIRQTYVFNYENKTVIKVAMNAKGESILNGTLYDYQGDDVVYTTPEDVTAVGGGIAQGNQTIRFLIIGDSVTTVGNYAFANSMIFGISFGENLKYIGEYAFFNLSYLSEAVFYGTQAPEISTGAFINLVDGTTLVPTFMRNSITRYRQSLIYTPLSLSSAGSWWDPPECQPYIDAFNESLKGVEGIENVMINGKPVQYGKYDSYYGTGQIAQLATDGLYSNGTQYKSDFGTVTMTGAKNPSAVEGYAIVDFNDSVKFEKGYAFYTSTNLPGYNESDAPVRLTVMYGIENGEFVSEIYTGKFVSGTQDTGNFILQGKEAGAYGEFDKDKLVLDGFGKFSLTYANGNTVDGAYTMEGSTVKLEGVKASIVFDADNASVTFNENVLTAVGEEAGVYYDNVNGAKITLDGKTVKVSEIDGDTVYNGTLQLEYNEVKTTSYYTIDYKTIKFSIDGNLKEWTYSSTGDYRVQGYYGPGSYDNQLTFKNEVKGLNGTFKAGSATLTIDGFYSATLIDGTNSQKCKYYQFADTNSILLLEENDHVVIYIDNENKTFEYATAAEAGKWLTTASAKYSWYLDGKGNLLYYTSNAYDIGQYKYDRDTKEFAVSLNGYAAQNNEVGMLDAENGVGTVTWLVGTSNSYAGISKSAFGEKYVATSFIAALDEKGAVVTTNPYFSVIKVNSGLLVSTAGNPFAFVELDGEISDGSQYEFEYTLKKENTKITSKYCITFTEKDNNFTIAIMPVDYYTAEGKVMYEETQYTVSWINSTHAIVWTMESWGGNILVSGDVTNGQGSAFMIGDYTVTGYGTADAKIEKTQTEEE